MTSCTECGFRQWGIEAGCLLLLSDVFFQLGGGEIFQANTLQLFWLIGRTG